MAKFLYLEHFLDYLEELPGELNRNLSLMRDLDERTKNMKCLAGVKADGYLTEVTHHQLSGSEKCHRQAEIQTLFDKCQEYSEDKVNLAIQTYELVDKYIRRLDTDLARFEKDLRSKCAPRIGQQNGSAGAMSTPTSISTTDSMRGTKSGKIDKRRSKKSHVMKAGGSNNKKSSLPGKKGRKSDKSTTSVDSDEQDTTDDESMRGGVELVSLSALAASGVPGVIPGAPANVLDMPVDPNEPTYCLCQQVSYGEMIGCDNTDCVIEWFHFGCVNLSSKPKGKWYCPNCAPYTKKGSKK